MSIKDIQLNEREQKIFDSLYKIIEIVSWQQILLSRQQKALDNCKEIIEEQKEIIHKLSSKISMSPMTPEEKEKYQKEYEEEVEKAKRNYYGENYKKDPEE